MSKPLLRKKYKELRQQLSLTEVDDFSLAIANKLLTLDIWDKTFYHIFLTIEEQKEINTDYILNILSGKDKNIVISKSNFEDYSMTHYLLTDNTRIQKNTYNIPEPIDGIEIPSSQLEVVFIPLLAFDNTGHRIGYGKGFYDRFLADCKPETVKIGLSFFEAEHETIEASEEDIRLDYCVTPDHIITF
ncbi:5-formyltetrahydrofolate cyclo-ligase [Winogradskyella psychrotolerans RS-3]|uniref:5-formyltetrahydrofolate cyclo-ligase n=1 Tax=Winogradskyella psychrotolerans RS-3 TaxID=641526 RepID=S7X1I6_9FLAO|nr:5-formyltetrahydrofolate cyclo-ligase [Winogradskyella psychrotolerans]EPR69998.1 5-formyltetrahydrofolate cyclo-ligase [Winogradskyella psychrotolerans RS-3]